MQGSAPPLHAPNTTNRSALAANTAVRFNRGRSALWEQSIRSTEINFAEPGAASDDSTKCSAPEPVEKPDAVGALQFPQFATLLLVPQNSSAASDAEIPQIAAPSPLIPPCTSTEGGALCGNRVSEVPKIDVVGELIYSMQGSAPPLHAPNTTNRSALTSNTAVHFNRGRSALREQRIRSAESISRNQVSHRTIPRSAPPLHYFQG